MKDLKGILKVKVVKNRAAGFHVRLSNTSLGSPMNNMIDPRLNCSFSNYDKDIKCNSSDSPSSDDLEDPYNIG